MSRLTGPNQDNVVGYWPLNEGSGTTAYDYSPLAVNASISGAIYNKNEDGSYSLYFDGLNDTVNLGQQNFEGAYSIALWLKLSAFGTGVQYDYVISNGHRYSNNYVTIDVYPYSNQIDFATQDASSNGIGITVLDNELTDYVDKWIHVAVTYNPTTHTAIVYLNGDYYNESTNNSYGGCTRTANTLLGFTGSGTHANNKYYEGLIRLPIIYNTTLSAEEIQRIYKEQFIQ